MPLEMSITRGSDGMIHPGPGLCRLGDAIAELMSHYEFVLDRPITLEIGAEEEDLAFAICEPVGCV